MASAVTPGRGTASEGRALPCVCVGLDFGSRAARAVLVDAATNTVLAETEVGYQVGPQRRPSDDRDHPPARWLVIQPPSDFLTAMRSLLAWAGGTAEALRADVGAIGVSATSCTILAVDGQGEPLAFRDRFRNRDHAQVRLWMDHSADEYARRISDTGQPFLRFYSGRTSPEWSLAKAWQTLDEDPQLWFAADRWIDVGDWLVWQMTGNEVRSTSQASCKNHWQPDEGYPSVDALDAIHPGLSSWRDKLAPPHPVGTIAGTLRAPIAAEAGLRPGVSVSVAMVDAEAAMLGLGIVAPHQLGVVAGTSSCHISLTAKRAIFDGVESTGFSSCVPGLFDYLTGQAATGEMFAWLGRLLGPSGAARGRGDVLAELAGSLDPETGPGPLRLMDWWQGCRTPLGRTDLGGIIEGLSVSSSIGDLYRGMAEASALGLRYALSLHDAMGGIDEIRITGGLTRHMRLVRLHANVLHRPVLVPTTNQGSAVGSALAAVGAFDGALGSEGMFTTVEPTLADDRYTERFQWYVSKIGEFDTTRPRK